TTTAYASATAAQGIRAGGSATSVAGAISGLAPATIYHFRMVAENSGGTSVGADQTFTTLPTLIRGVKASPPGPPFLGHVSQSHRVWREASHAARFARKLPPVGTTFSFTLNEQAKVSFAFTQPSTGRKVGRRC